MNSKPLYYFLSWLSYILTAFLIWHGFVSHHIDMNWLFTSDTLYLNALYSDVFVSHHSFSSWKLTPAPYFFPDMLFSFIINFFEKNIFYLFLIYALAQNFLFLFLIHKMTWLITQSHAKVMISHALFLIFLCYFATETVIPYSFNIMSTYHAGSLVNGLIFLCFLFCCFKHPNRLFYQISLALITALGSASDLFFILWFVIPSFLSFFQIKKVDKSKASFLKKIMYIILFSGIISLLIKNSLTPDMTKGYAFALTTRPWIRVRDLFSTAYHLFSNHIFLFFLNLIFYVMTTRIYFDLKKQKIKNISMSESFLIRFIFFSSLISVLNIIFSKLAGIIIDIQAFRYLLNVFWFPVFYFWLIFSSKSKFFAHDFLNDQKKIGFISIVFFVFVFITCLINKKPWDSHYFEPYFPALAKCLDTNIHDYNERHTNKIKYGVAFYWQAKLVSSFSLEKLQVAAINSNLEFLTNITSTSTFHEKNDFIIINNADHSNPSSLIIQRYGEALEKFNCDPNYQVFIYQPGTIEIGLAKENHKK